MILNHQLNLEAHSGDCMPFGKWTNFQACLTDMMGAPNNYDEETAKKTCGKLQARLEGKEVFRILKSKSGRRILAQYVHVEGLDLEGDIIPNHRAKEALDDLKGRDPRTHNVMWRHSSYQIGWPLWTFTDEDGNLHKTEVDEYGVWGITEIRNDGYQKADEIWNQILRDKNMGASIGVASPDGHMIPIILTKDEIQRRGLRKDWEGARYWDIPLQFIEPWSLTSQPANQYVTNAQILAKDICEPCVKARAKWYIRKGICKTMTDALARARDFYVRYNEKELNKQDEKEPLTEEEIKRRLTELYERRSKLWQTPKDPLQDKKDVEANLISSEITALEHALANVIVKQQDCPEGEHWDEDEEACAPDEVEGEEEITKSMKLAGEEIFQKYWK